MLKRKRVVLSIEQKLEIVQKSENGTNVKTLVKEYNVGDSTVRDIIKNGPKFIEFSDVSEGGKSYMSSRKTMKTSTYDDLDKAMLTWYSQQKARGGAVSDAVSVAKAKYFFDTLKLKGDFNASSGWLRRFKHRHGIDQMPVKDERSTFADSAADECSDQFDLSLGAEDLIPGIVKLDVESIKSENLSDNEFIADYRIPKEFIAQFQMIFKIKEYVPKAGIPAIVYLRDGKKYAGIELENVSEPEAFDCKVNILEDDIKSENCDASSNKSTDDKYFCDDDDDFYLSEDSSNRTTRPGDTIKLQRLFKILPKKKKKIKGRIHSKTKDENRKKIPKLKVKCISSKKKYDRSLKINNSFIEFNCHLCPEEFDIWETLEIHTQEIHSTKPKISCLCDKFLRSKKTVYSHILKHDKTIVRHKCEFCKTKFVSEKNYKQHILSFHTSDKNNPSLCDKCDMSFENLYLLKLHSKKHHLQEEKTIFSCDICGDKFSAKGSVQRHIKIVHEKEKNQICHVCGKSYHDKGDLVDHLTKHTNIRAFQCPHCPKNYKTRSSYKKHFDSHNGIKHKCDKCPAEFNLRSTLRQHKYVHDDVCRFVCSVCDKGFKWRRSFKTHMNTHTGDKPFSCPWCPKKFADGPNCRIHKKRNHPVELAEYEAQHGITSRKGIEIINMPEPKRESGEQPETNNMKMTKISQLTSTAIALLTQ